MKEEARKSWALSQALVRWLEQGISGNQSRASYNPEVRIQGASRTLLSRVEAPGCAGATWRRWRPRTVELQANEGSSLQDFSSDNGCWSQ